MNRFPLPVRLASLALLSTLAACGGGGGGSGIAPPPPPPPPPPPGLDTQYLVSGNSPFAANCDGVAASGTVYINAEVEPYLAVNPLDPNRMVGAWQQDRWSNGSARGVVSGTSLDGGQTWTKTPLPFSRCGGGNAGNAGDYARSTDPWVTYAPDGTAYAIGLSTNGGSFQAGSANAVLVSKSTDDGRNWINPVALISDGAGFFNDKESITADPVNPNFVYATWDRLVANSNNGPTYFARTSNGGASWEAARPIYDPGPNSQTIGNVIAVLPNGTLVDVFVQIDTAGSNQTSTIRVIRSSDRGLTWSAPTTVADLLSVGTKDPQTGTAVRDGALIPQIAAAPNGNLFVVWQDARFNSGNYDAIAISRSIDGGLTWSTPARVNPNSGVAAFIATVRARPDGVVGVTYYDFRSDTATAPLLTDYWLARSSNNGTTWTEYRVSQAFDLSVAPNAGGYFLGDYQALVNRGNVFVPFFVKANDGNTGNRTDVFSAPAVTAKSSASVAAAPASVRSNPFHFSPGNRLRQRVSDNIERATQARLLPANNDVPAIGNGGPQTRDRQ